MCKNAFKFESRKGSKQLVRMPATKVAKMKRRKSSNEHKHNKTIIQFGSVQATKNGRKHVGPFKKQASNRAKRKYAKE